MADFNVKIEDATYKVTAPDEATAWKWANAEHSKSVKTITAPPEKIPASTADKIAANPITRFALGAADPIIGGFQKLANFAPAFRGPTFEEIITNKKPQNEVATAVNNNINQLDSMIDRGRGSDGLDVPRLTGSFLSPVNAGMAKALPNATSTLGRAATGFMGGTAGASLSPVNTSGGQDVASVTAAQSVTGGVAGGLLGPVLGLVVDKVAPKVLSLIDRFKGNAEITGARASLEADTLIINALREVGAKADDLSKMEMQKLRDQVIGSLKTGKKLDAAALMRSEDFKNLGIDPLKGWVTRDSNQFAREKNLRGVPGVGEPIMNRIDEGNKKVQQLVAQLRGEPAEPYQAGVQIRDTLKNIDDQMSSQVRAEYTAARASSGKEAEVGLTGLAQDYANTLDRFGDKVPSGVRNQFNKYGLGGEKQTKVFTVDEADKLLKTINDHVGADKATNNALSELRNAVKRSMTEGSVDDVFSKPRSMAAQRFKLHEELPAMEAASNGAQADNFVRDYIVGGKVEEVKRLADILKKTNPDAFNQAKAQIGEKIARAAFGENVAGDKLAAPERLAAALRTIGTDKLSAFYTPQEIEQLKRLSRVTAYMNSKPTDAPVNTSNNIQALTSLLTKIPFVPSTVALGSAAKNAVKTRLDAKAALDATVPSTPNMSDEQRKALVNALIFGTGAVTGASIP